MKIVFLDVAIGSSAPNRITIELFDESVPKTAENFRALCTGEMGVGATTKAPLCFKGTRFHRVISGFMMQGGDIEHKSGKGGESIYGGKFCDEKLDGQHSKPYMLSMANAGPNSNGSQFFIAFTPIPHLDGKHVVFGRVVLGTEVVDEIEKLPTGENDIPRKSVVIVNCGELRIKAKTEVKESVEGRDEEKVKGEGKTRRAATASQSSNSSRSSSQSSSSSDDGQKKSKKRRHRSPSPSSSSTDSSTSSSSSSSSSDGSRYHKRRKRSSDRNKSKSKKRKGKKKNNKQSYKKTHPKTPKIISNEIAKADNEEIVIEEPTEAEATKPRPPRSEPIITPDGRVLRGRGHTMFNSTKFNPFKLNGEGITRSKEDRCKDDKDDKGDGGAGGDGGDGDSSYLLKQAAELDHPQWDSDGWRRPEKRVHVGAFAKRERSGGMVLSDGTRVRRRERAVSRKEELVTAGAVMMRQAAPSSTPVSGKLTKAKPAPQLAIEDPSHLIVQVKQSDQGKGDDDEGGDGRDRDEHHRLTQGNRVSRRSNREKEGERERCWWEEGRLRSGGQWKGGRDRTDRYGEEWSHQHGRQRRGGDWGSRRRGEWREHDGRRGGSDDEEGGGRARRYDGEGMGGRDRDRRERGERREEEDRRDKRDRLDRQDKRDRRASSPETRDVIKGGREPSRSRSASISEREKRSSHNKQKDRIKSGSPHSRRQLCSPPHRGDRKERYKRRSRNPSPDERDSPPSPHEEKRHKKDISRSRSRSPVVKPLSDSPSTDERKTPPKERFSKQDHPKLGELQPSGAGATGRRRNDDESRRLADDPDRHRRQREGGSRGSTPRQGGSGKETKVSKGGKRSRPSSEESGERVARRGSPKSRRSRPSSEERGERGARRGSPRSRRSSSRSSSSRRGRCRRRSTRSSESVRPSPDRRVIDESRSKKRGEMESSLSDSRDITPPKKSEQVRRVVTSHEEADGMENKTKRAESVDKSITTTSASTGDGRDVRQQTMVKGGETKAVKKTSRWDRGPLKGVPVSSKEVT
eukprot:GHVN01090221.1.p1 GENE.GHVN01090221.1~~GHVN01090221.1.p1  ORF type:complete len:1028 (-),score=268.37 GHVN01090221.1:811-3894(-)